MNVRRIGQNVVGPRRELSAIISAGREDFETMRTTVEATIHLPFRELHKDDLAPVRVTDEMLLLPFPCVEFVERFSVYESDTDRYRASGIEYMIVFETMPGEPESNLSTISKIVFTDVAAWEKSLSVGLPIYLPHKDLPQAAHGLIALKQFNELLRRRDHTFVETPQTRSEVRRLRREGYSDTYAEYVVLRKDNPQYHLGSPIRRMLPMLRRKHKVRGHYRRFWKGVALERPIRVRKHERCRTSEQSVPTPRVYVVR